MTRYPAFLLGAAALCGPAQAEMQPSAFNGIWQIMRPVPVLRQVDGALPPLQPAARAQYDKAVAVRKASDTKFDPTAACQPPGVPRTYMTGRPFDILVGARQTFMTFEWNRLFRVIDMNTTHDAQNVYGETFYGWSTGQWRGGALSVDTVSVLDSTLLDDAGLPHSIDLHTVETWTLNPDGTRLNLAITFDDPKIYTKPWTARLTFRRLPKDYVIAEDVCVERTGMTTDHP